MVFIISKTRRLDLVQASLDPNHLLICLAALSFGLVLIAPTANDTVETPPTPQKQMAQMASFTPVSPNPELAETYSDPTPHPDVGDEGRDWKPIGAILATLLGAGIFLAYPKK